jgi:DNA-binding CsgD family transcriptional regulator
VKLMRDRGLAYSQIGEALGVSEQTARKIGHELGFRGQPPVSLRVMTEEEEKRAAAVRRLRTKGLSYREIGEQLGISEHAAQKIGHELGFRGRPERPERPSKAEDLTSEQRGEIIVKAVGLRLKGMTYAKIGRRLGVPGPVVATVCRDAGFTD